MQKSVFIGLSVCSVLLGGTAQAMNFDHPITASIIIKNPQIHSTVAQKKKVVLMNLNLTPQQKKHFFNANTFARALYTSKATLPAKVELGMNNVPVLDQGMHGTCVTFATTAAIDAVTGKGDYVSQLCSLELGSYLEKNSYYPSGWDGSWGMYVLDQMQEFGIVSTKTQETTSCAGVKSYPLMDENNTGNPMSVTDYKAVSEDITNQVTAEQLLTQNQRLEWDPATEADQADAMLLHVKQSLAVPPKTGARRPTFGVIVLPQHCSAGACAHYHQTDDTWALSSEIKNDSNPELAGHEMVITGYDDNAVATDNDGNKHQGLLMLRNSWGNYAGDNGNYYMSYDYFKKYALEVQNVETIQNS